MATYLHHPGSRPSNAARVDYLTSDVLPCPTSSVSQGGGSDDSASVTKLEYPGQHLHHQTMWPAIRRYGHDHTTRSGTRKRRRDRLTACLSNRPHRGRRRQRYRHREQLSPTGGNVSISQGKAVAAIRPPRINDRQPSPRGLSEQPSTIVTSNITITQGAGSGDSATVSISTNRGNVSIPRPMSRAIRPAIGQGLRRHGRRQHRHRAGRRER